MNQQDGGREDGEGSLQELNGFYKEISATFAKEEKYAVR